MLNKIIGLMDKEELRAFKLFANRTRGDEDRKDLRLFEYMRRSGEKFRERKILKELYGLKGKNAYYRLKNRLLGEVGKSLVLQHLNKDENLICLHFLGLSMLYKSKQQPGIAHFYLKKVEKKAIEQGRLELLDLVYAEYITLSYDLVEIDPEAVIKKRSENRKTLNRLWEIDHILAAITHRLKVSVNFADSDHDVLNLLEKTVSEYAKDPEINKNEQFRFRLFNAVSKILIQKKDYEGLENFLIPLYEEFLAEGLFHKANHEVKLQMLTYILNALVKNKKPEMGTVYVKHLQEGMEEHSRLLYDKYLFFYFNTQANIYSMLDKHRAIEILQEALAHEQLRKVPAYQVYIYMNLALHFYSLQEFQKSIQSLVKLSLQDGYANLDEVVKLKVTVFELVLRYQLEETEVLDYRIRQCRQEFSKIFDSDRYRKEQEMVGILEQLNKSLNPAKDEKLKALVLEFIEAYKPEDTDFLDYNEFLVGVVKV